MGFDKHLEFAELAFLFDLEFLQKSFDAKLVFLLEVNVFFGGFPVSEDVEGSRSSSEASAAQVRKCNATSHDGSGHHFWQFPLVVVVRLSFWVGPDGRSVFFNVASRDVNAVGEYKGLSYQVSQNI